MNSFEIGRYKNDLMYMMLDNEQIVRLLDPLHEFKYKDDLVYERIFPYGRIPITEQETKAYLTITVNVENLMRDNHVMRDIRLTVRAISHVSIMKVEAESMNRVDLLSAYVDKMLSGSQNFGVGPMEIVSNKEYTLDEQHFYREIIFQTSGLNKPACR